WGAEIVSSPAAGGSNEAVRVAKKVAAEHPDWVKLYQYGNAANALAHALSARSPESAADEARTALGVFRQLGAARAVDAACGVLRDLEDPRAGGPLTAREQEVLELVALGMSNARIAEALVITEKTAGHHVSNILSKLGVRNRTEAAAHARRPTAP
ncbi:MAG: response regulator transcription factor, partial [Actinomycetota bacterium]|nr:response regulator transcription factor [Actinomycetota bacterium]